MDSEGQGILCPAVHGAAKSQHNLETKIITTTNLGLPDGKEYKVKEKMSGLWRVWNVKSIRSLANCSFLHVMHSSPAKSIACLGQEIILGKEQSFYQNLK